MSVHVSKPGGVVEESRQTKGLLDHGWNVIVWNDHVNLMGYVVHVFRQVFGFPEAKARKHMMEVHQLGKSLLATETRERAELHWQQLQQFGLRTSLEKAD